MTGPRHINAQFDIPTITRRELQKPLQAVFARHHLPRREQQVLDAMIYFSYQELPDRRKFEIPTRAFRNLIGYRRNELSELKRAVEALYEVPIKWGSVEGDGEWGGTRFISYARVTGQTVTFEYPEPMAIGIAEAVQCATLDPARIRSLKTQYGKRLYEIGRWFLPEGTTGYSDIALWRNWFLDGSPKYSEFKAFNRNVIKAAARDVTDNTELTIIPEYLGRPTTHLQFRITTDPAEEAKIGREVRGSGLPALIELGIIDDPNAPAAPETAKDQGAIAQPHPDPEVEGIKTAFRREFGVGSSALAEHDGMSKNRWAHALEEVRAAKQSGVKVQRTWAAYAVGTIRRIHADREEPLPSATEDDARTQSANDAARQTEQLTPYTQRTPEEQEKLHDRFLGDRDKLLQGLRISYPDDYPALEQREFEQWQTEKGLR